VCYFGDSITEGWIDAERRPSEAYPSLVDSILRRDGVDVRSIIAAKGGETTEDALARFERDVRAENPAVVVFAFGANDCFVWGSTPAPRVSLARFRFNCRVMLEALSGSGSRSIVLPPPPILESRFYRYADSLLYVPYGGAARLRDEYAEAVSQLATDFPCVRVLRLDPLLLPDTATLGFDGLHPSALGHRRIAGAVAEAVLAALDQPCRGESGLEAIGVYPMPFNRQTTSVSSIGIPASIAGTYTIRLIDSLGRIVRTFEYIADSAGYFSILWDGRNENGTIVAPGAYILTVSTPQGSDRSLSIIVM
jgi:acyl-CoA thioesterase-1